MTQQDERKDIIVWFCTSHGIVPAVGEMWTIHWQRTGRTNHRVALVEPPYRYFDGETEGNAVDQMLHVIESHYVFMKRDSEKDTPMTLRDRHRLAQLECWRYL